VFPSPSTVRLLLQALSGVSIRRAELFGGLTGVSGIAVLVAALALGDVGDTGPVVIFVAALAVSGLTPVVVSAGRERYGSQCDEIFVVGAIVALPSAGVIMVAAAGSLLARLLSRLVRPEMPLSLQPVKVVFAVGKAALNGLAAVTCAELLVQAGPSPALPLVAAVAGGLAFALSDHVIMLLLLRMLGQSWSGRELAANLQVAGISILGGAVLAGALLGPLSSAVWVATAVAVLVAVSRSLRRARQDHDELGAVMQIVKANRETDPEEVKRLLTGSAATLLFATTAEIRFTPPSQAECGAELRIEGRPAWLVVGDRQGSVPEFSPSEQALLRSLAAIGQTALDSAHLHARAEAHAHRCELTGLLNRRGVRQRFAKMAIAPSGTPIALLFADLDGFKKVNDTYGHEVGDQLLVEVARRLEHHVRDRDIVARWSGDEFLIVLTETDDGADAHALARRIDETLRAPYTMGPDARVSASVGLASGVLGIDELTTLVEEADRAMYAIKAKRTAPSTGRSAPQGSPSTPTA
jgi:diguanylate cyclase (GGDEF)-like protein